MPKRKHKEKRRHIERKIRRLKKRLDYCSSDVSEDEDCGYDDDRDYCYRSSIPSRLDSDNEIPVLPLSDSEDSIGDHSHNQPRDTTSVPKSVIVVGNTTSSEAAVHPEAPLTSTSEVTPTSTALLASIDTPGPSSEATTLPVEILEALGDPKTKEEVFGPNIPDEIAERWGRVLLDGLAKEQKQQLTEKYLIPANFRLAKAPLLNLEIFPVLTEAAKNRDKLMEKTQNQLGLGISELTKLASKVIHQKDLNKIEILKNISEISQIFLDLHYEDTKRRRKLITAALDKKFIDMVSDVKRDTYLFGSNLGEKIKASKTAERSGLQIKRADPTLQTSFKRNPHQGNWKGPPRVQNQRAHRPGGPKRQYSTQSNRRPLQAANRPPRTPNKTLKSQKP